MLKLNIGVAKKVGEANYGSRGASVNLELEVESGVVRDPDQLKGKIRHLFGLAKQSVEEELNGSRQPNGRSATQSQLRVIHAIADRHRVDLTAVLRDDYSVAQAGELSISQASQLIDQLKAHGSGTGGQR